jgi:amino acid adenylation domain-containing protein
MHKQIQGFRLSSQQTRLWQWQRGGNNSVAQCAICLEGDLRAETLRQAIQKVVSSHDILRTTFHSSPGIKIPIQVINEQSTLLWPNIDITDLDALEQSAQIETLLQQECCRPFNFERGPLMRLQMITLAANRHMLLVTLAALCGDGQSLKHLVRQIIRAYDDLTERNAPAFDEDGEEAPTQYLQFSEWQNQLLKAVDAARGKAYWEKLRLGAEGGLHLPCEMKTEGPRRAQHNSLKLTTRAEVAALMTAVARKYDVSNEIVLLSAWLTLLWRLTGNPDLAVSSLFNGREYEELHEVLGPFAQFLPVRCQFHEGLPFKAILRNLSAGMREAAGWQEYFIDEECAETDANGGSSPIGFEYEEALAPLYGGGLLFSVYEWWVCLQQFQIKLSCVADSGSLRTDVHYDPQWFSSEHIRCLAGQFHTLLESAVRSPEATIAELDMLAEDECQQLLVEFNATQCAYPKEKPVHQLFEEQVARTPEAIALTFIDQHVSYAEINARANQVAHYLRRLGVGPEVVVGICAERSMEMVAAVLGVLKAGGAYLPLDPAHPPERLSFMLKDASVSVVLAQQRVVGRLPGHEVQLVCLDADWPRLSQESMENLPQEADAENLAYVIYTSGSTGLPKGVMIPHRGLVNYLSWCTKVYRVAEGQGAPLHSSLGFDLSVTSLFPPLLVGGRVLLVDEERGIEELREILHRERGFSLVKITPSHLEVLSKLVTAEEVSEHTPRVLVIGGEALGANSLAFWRQHAPATRLINEYGPTETVVGCCVYEVEAGKVLAGAVPIGRPIANTQLYVLNSALRPVPTGVAGELYIGGDGVGRGYLNRPALTAERFIPDPFSHLPGARLYRTGDLARHLPEGQLDCLGRIDRQVKVRGYRIEPGEIESVLAQHPQVREAAVIGRELAGGETQLVSYIVPQQKPAPTTNELLHFLHEKLPAYMAPSVLVILDRMPLTANGKVDFRALPPPDSVRGDLRDASDRPRTTTEHVLAAIWSEVLSLKQIGVHDNFFALGGDSIRSVRMLALAKERGFKFTLQDIFKHQTIYSLAREVKLDDETGPAPRTEPFSLVSEIDLPKLPQGLEDAYPLSQMQLGMLYHMELIPQAPSYHNVSSYHVRANFDEECLLEAASRVVNRHPVLRTSFDLITYSEPLQLVHPTCLLPIPIMDLRQLSSGEQEKELAAFVDSEWKRLFDLSKPPLVRFHVHRRSDGTFQFTVTECHAIVDGWSITSTFAELFSTHFELLENNELPLKPPPAVAFRDYVASERKALTSEACRQYWKEKLDDCTALKLPRSNSRTRKAGEPRIGKVPVPISKETSEGLKQLANKLAVPLKSVMLAVHLKALSVVTGEHDVLTGLAGNGRPEDVDAEEVRGLYVLTSPLRITLNDGTWADLIRDTFKAEWELLPYRLYPMAALQKTAGGQLLLETEFHYLHFHSVADLLRSGKLEILDNIDRSETNFTLLVGCQMNPVTSELTLDLHCDMTELSDKQVEALVGYYAQALTALLAEPQRKHNSVSLLSPRERQQLLIEWNSEERTSPENQCLHQLFEERVKRMPETVALVFENQRLTYDALNRQANQLAHYLRGLGVGPEALVAICVERSVEMLVGILGILKAGGAYVPLDPAYPKERLAFILEDTQARVLLTQQSLTTTLPEHDGRVVLLDAEWPTIAGESEENPANEATANTLAYVIYTSGSTGKPKGVLVSHDNVTRLFEATQPHFQFDEKDVWTLFHSYAFDFSVWELWGALLYGGKLVIVPYWVSRSAEAFYCLLDSEQVTVLSQTPSAFSQLMGLDESAGVSLKLRLVIFGGEALELQKLRPWFARHGDQFPQLVNMFGITETTVHVTYRPLTMADLDLTSSSVIGRPLSCLQVYLLDRRGQLVPVGVPAEICVGGTGIVRGYLNRAELTAERFIPHPFSHKAGTRLYRSGDLGRYLPDGDIEYLGRIDSQVKVRGFRIELGEIESALAKHPAVRDCTVIARDDIRGETRLVAYLVAGQQPAPSTTELRDFLREKLPEHMVPATFIILDVLPLTPNGKIDRGALPAPDQTRPQLGEEFVAPRTPVEKQLAKIWQELLSVEEVGVHDHFFDLGGDSLVATQLISRVRKVFQVDIPLSDLLSALTVAEFAGKIQAANRTRQDETTKPATLETLRGAADEFPLSFAQERLWMFDQIIPDKWAYNIPIRVRLRGSLRIDTLEASLTEVVRRHESLRTRFVVKDDRVVQVVDEPKPIRIEVCDLQELTEPEREVETSRLCAQQARQSFDLSRGPLLRAGLLWLAEDDYVATLTTHHIVSDDWSMVVLIDELVRLYGAFCDGESSPLAELSFQYVDYALWQRDWLQGEACKAQLSYWKQQLADSPKALHLPTDRPRPAIQTFRGASQRLELTSNLAASLKTLGREEHATLFMTLLAAFNILLKHYSGQEGILIGTPIANRTRLETERLIGCLMNTLVLRPDLSGDPTFRELLGRVRQITLQAYAHQDLPFEKLLEELKPERDTSRPPLFQVMLSMHNVPMPPPALRGLTLSPLESDHTTAKYDLLLNMRETGQGLTGVMEYNSDLFDAVHIARLLRHFELLLSRIAARPDAQLSEMVGVLSEDERSQQLIKEANLEEARRQKYQKVKRKALAKAL